MTTFWHICTNIMSGDLSGRGEESEACLFIVAANFFPVMGPDRDDWQGGWALDRHIKENALQNIKFHHPSYLFTGFTFLRLPHRPPGKCVGKNKEQELSKSEHWVRFCEEQYQTNPDIGTSYVRLKRTGYKIMSKIGLNFYQYLVFNIRIF